MTVPAGVDPVLWQQAVEAAVTALGYAEINHQVMAAQRGTGWWCPCGSDFAGSVDAMRHVTEARSTAVLAGALPVLQQATLEALAAEMEDYAVVGGMNLTITGGRSKLTRATRKRHVFSSSVRELILKRARGETP